MPRWQAGQACCGGSGWLGPPDARGSGATLFSQHSGHSRCGRPCRPCPCSHTKYAAPAASTRLSLPPKGRPGALGMRGGIAVHLSIGTAARPWVIARAVPFSVAPSGWIDRTARRRSPRRPVRPASRTALGLGDLAPRRRPALVTPWPALVTHRARDPPLRAAALRIGHLERHAQMDRSCVRTGRVQAWGQRRPITTARAATGTARPATTCPHPSLLE